MDVEKQAFGNDTEAYENNKNLESEDFKFYNQNKEEAKKNIDISAKDLTDYIDSLIEDVPDPSEEEIKAGVEKILQRTHPDNGKSNKAKKVTLSVLFVAALLSAALFSCLFAVGNRHDISIENGFVSFAKDTVQVVFFNEDEEEYITVDALLTNLAEHGYDDILFPQEFVTKSDEYKVSVPEYGDDDFGEQVSFDIYNNTCLHSFVVYNSPKQQSLKYYDLKDGQTLTVDDVCINFFETKNKITTVEFFKDGYKYYINSTVPYYEMNKIIKTIK